MKLPMEILGDRCACVLEINVHTCKQFNTVQWWTTRLFHLFFTTVSIHLESGKRVVSHTVGFTATRL